MSFHQGAAEATCSTVLVTNLPGVPTILGTCSTLSLFVQQLMSCTHPLLGHCVEAGHTLAWQQPWWRGRGWGTVTYGSGRLSRGGALTQGFLSLTNQRPLVALHALQLLLSGHPATGPSSRLVHHVHRVQETLRSGLLTPGGKCLLGPELWTEPPHLGDWVMGGPDLGCRSLPQSDERRHGARLIRS